MNKENQENISLAITPELMFQQLFDNAQIGLMYISKDRKLLKANPRLAQIFAYDSPQEMEGLSMQSFHISEKNFIDFGEKNFSSLINGVNLNIEYPLKKKDGSSIWVMASGKALDENIPADLSKGVLWSIQDITERKSNEKKLLLEKNRSQHYLDISGSLIIGLDTQGIVTLINPLGCELLEADKKEILGKNWFHSFLLHDDVDMVTSYFTQLMTGDVNNVAKVQNRIKTAKGNIKNILWHNSLTHDENDTINGLLSSGIDVTQEYQLEQTLRKEHRNITSIINSVSDSIIVLDANYNVSLMNKTAESLLNKKHITDLSHPKCHEVSHQSKLPCESSNHPCPLHKAIESGEVQKEYHTHFNAKGEERLVQVSITPMKDDSGHIYSFVETSHDVTEVIALKDELHKQSHYDKLTGLPNWDLFLDLLREYIKHPENKNAKAAVILIDIDHFKSVNDSFGHQAGDLVIQALAKWIQNVIDKKNIVARFEGDSFVILLKDISNDLTPVNVLETLKKIVEKSAIDILDQEIYVTFSAGISLYPQDGINAENIFKNVDAALYQAKEAGRNTYAYYTNELTERAFQQVVMDSNLRDAIKFDEFVMYYQPQYNIEEEKLIGMEALIRWNHHSMGLVSPAQFIPLLEHSKLIIPVGLWIIKTVFEQRVSWEKQGYHSGVVSLNLSMLQLEEGNELVENIENLLDETGCKAEWIGLEITESMVMKDIEKIICVLDKLSNLGFLLSMDDFGTGYSSLSYLKKMPINKLKIDQSFIHNLPDDDEDSMLSQTIIAMAKNLHLEVIAEGVETQEQVTFLLEHGCQEVQGYLFGKPMPVEEITKTLQIKST